VAIGKLPLSRNDHFDFSFPVGGVKDCNCVNAGYIDKYLISIAPDLKALRMRRQSKIGSPACLRGVDDRERPVAITNGLCSLTASQGALAQPLIRIIRNRRI